LLTCLLTYTTKAPSLKSKPASNTMLWRVLIAVVILCGPDDFIYDFIKKASSPEVDMTNGQYGEFMYMSIRTVHDDVVHPWSVFEQDDPSESTLEAFHNLMQVTPFH